MKYKIWLNEIDEFTLTCNNQYVQSFTWIAEALVHIAELEQIDFEAKFSESYMLDVLTYNHGLQIEVLD